MDQEFFCLGSLGWAGSKIKMNSFENIVGSALKSCITNVELFFLLSLRLVLKMLRGFYNDHDFKTIYSKKKNTKRIQKSKTSKHSTELGTKLSRSMNR